MIRRFPHGKGLVADDALALSTRSLLCFSHFSSGNEYASLCTSHKVMKEKKKRKWRIKRKRNKGKNTKRGGDTHHHATTPKSQSLQPCTPIQAREVVHWSLPSSSLPAESGRTSELRLSPSLVAFAWHFRTRPPPSSQVPLPTGVLSLSLASRCSPCYDK